MIHEQGVFGTYTYVLVKLVEKVVKSFKTN